MSLSPKPVALAACVLCLCAISTLAQTPDQASYFEFGKVVAIGHTTVDIQTFDPQRQRLVQHSFALSKETRADIVHVGDSVEVVFVPLNGDWALRRMIVLAGGIPREGAPPPAGAQASAPPLPATQLTTPQTAWIQPPVSRPATSQPSAAPPTASAVQIPTPKPKPVKKAVHNKPLPAPSIAINTPPPVAPNSLAVSAAPKTLPGVVPVSLGAAPESIVKARSVKDASIDHPAYECNRSSQDWPAQPLRIAVLDFRYPTDREESHDIGTTGGGSGTAVADLVFSRLESLQETDDRYAFSRGDRRRLDRADFAGAARLGRQLGVDAVLAGTFVPVPSPNAADDPFAPKTYELRAGLVDTCTGQLLMQTSSVSCVGGLEPGLTAGADPASCHRLATSATETADPKSHAQAYKPLLDDLLFPLEHDGRPPGTPGSAGVVSGVLPGVNGNQVTIQLAPRSQVRPGDQLPIQASRLIKNPTTYTLQNLQSAEIGKVSIQTVSGGTARGVFIGDYVPRLGDAVQLPSH